MEQRESFPRVRKEATDLAGGHRLGGGDDQPWGLAKTLDGGLTWTRHTAPRQGQPWTLYVADSMTCWAEGSDSSILATADGRRRAFPAPFLRGLTRRKAERLSESLEAYLAANQPRNRRRVAVLRILGKFFRTSTLKRIFPERAPCQGSGIL